ncbi:hypothetical protein ALO79_200064 [Pseudomonas syringae pv. castaneae]|uniref:Resolvase n=1 Tax=Pseudomonas syringae pv. castaneae TaxID=264450 RepID=A0A0P9SIM7_PSESX|nr:hypothetical protein ALO79_200064 [Pseudomonas syringae pv. castaneae]
MFYTEAFVPALSKTSYPLQRLQQLARFLADFLAMHFHAQAYQCLAHFLAGPGLRNVRQTHGSRRSRSLFSSSSVAWKGVDSS